MPKRSQVRYRILKRKRVSNRQFYVQKQDVIQSRSSFDDVYELLDTHRKEEGPPPRIVERIFGWLIYSSLRRHTNRVRRNQFGEN